MAAYRESYGTNYVLIRLIENWKKAFDEKFLVGTVLITLSKGLIVFHTTNLLQNYTSTASVKKQLLSSIRILNVGKKK